MGELIQNQADATDGSGFHDLTGREIGRYHIQKRLGRGGITTVYQAYDMVDGFPVALKVLLHSTDEKVYNRFRYEAQTASKLQHPNIVRTLRVGVATGNDSAYIAMELVEGEDLSALLASRRRLAAEESCLLLAPIAQALAYAHKRGVIHRDVKPSNILLRTVGAGAPNNIVLDSLDYPLVPLLSDFGIARALDVPELTHSGRTVGTPAFMAPEQCLGRRNVDHRADLYALGAVFYRCVTGRQPFIGSTVQILHAHVYEPITINDEILRQLSQTHLKLLQRSLAKDPDERYQSADEMAADLALGANPADLQMTTAQREEHTTLTLDLIPVGKPAPTSGQSTVLVPSAIEPTPTPSTATITPVSAEPEVYYDRELDHRLRKISGVVLFILLVVISFFLTWSLFRVSFDTLWQRFSDSWFPLQTPVLALSQRSQGTMMGLASGSGDIRQTSGFVPLFPTVTPTRTPPPLTPTATPLPTLAPTTRLPVALVNLLLNTTIPPIQAAVTEPCTHVPAVRLLPYIAQLDSVIQADFQCATAAMVSGGGELLQFEQGYMLYLDALDLMFIASTADQQWEDLDVGWLDGDTIPPFSPIDVPEEGKFTPQQMFGKIWYNADLRIRLGNAIMPTAARFPILAQKFPGGWLVLDLERPTARFVFLREQRRW